MPTHPHTPSTPPEPWITRRVRLSIAAPGLRAAGAHRAHRSRARRRHRHPARLHRLRLRPVPDPHPERHGRLADGPRRSGPWASTSPASPAPAAPSRTRRRPGSGPSWPTAGGCCRSPWARRPRATRGSPATTTTSGSTRARLARTAPPACRDAPRPPRRWLAPRSWAWARAARSGTTWRPTTAATPPAASPRCRSCPAWTRRLHKLDYVSGVYSSAGSGIADLDNARVNRPGRLRDARPHLDRQVGRHGQHLDVLHPRRRLAPGRPHEAVQRRPQRDLGRRHDQHRLQLARPRKRVQGGPGPGVLRRGAAQLPLLPQAAGGCHRRPRRSAAVPAHHEGRVHRRGERHARHRHHGRRRLPGGSRTGSPRPASSDPPRG